MEFLTEVYVTSIRDGLPSLLQRNSVDPDSLANLQRKSRTESVMRVILQTNKSHSLCLLSSRLLLLNENAIFTALFCPDFVVLPFCWGNILPAHFRGSFKDMPILQLYSTGGQAPAHCSYKPEQSYFGFSTIIHRTLLVAFKNPDLLNAFSVLFCQLYFDAMQEHLCFC